MPFLKEQRGTIYPLLFIYQLSSKGGCIMKYTIKSEEENVTLHEGGVSPSPTSMNLFVLRPGFMRCVKNIHGNYSPPK